MKISIIVPAYNTSLYLEKCLESLVNQSLKDIEIICVDDGSTDNSLDILKRYAQKDVRIKVLTQKNQGQSVARNIGASFAKGEYIGFVDSDDWVESTMFEKLYESAKKFDTDITMCSITVYDEKTDKKTCNDPYMGLKIFPKSFDGRAFNPEETYDFIFRICVSPCNKIYRQKLLKQNSIKFPQGLFFEDNVFFVEVYLNAQKCSLIRDYEYFYRRFSKTSTCSGDDYKKLDFYKVYEITEDLIKTRGLYEKLGEYFKKSKKDTLLYWYKKLSDEKVKQEYMAKFEKIYGKQ